jgi:uncharacterized protein GlcG (DUF336 family)
VAKITLALANSIIEGAFARGAELKLNPLACLVLNAGGIPISYQCQDGSPTMRYAIVMGKAWGALGIGRSSRTFLKLGEERPAVLQSLVGVFDGRLMAAAGGVIIRDAGGEVIGAAAVSGDTGDNDEICCAAGIEAAGLVADLSV